MRETSFRLAPRAVATALALYIVYILWQEHVRGISVPTIGIIQPETAATAIYYLVTGAALATAMAIVFAPGYTFLAGVIWAVIDAVFWMDVRSSLAVLTFSLAVHIVYYARHNGIGITGMLRERTYIAFLASGAAAALVAYELLQRAPLSLVGSGLLRGDAGILIATISTTLLWDIVAAVAALLTISLIALPAYRIALSLLGGQRVRIAALEEEFREEEYKELSGQLESLLSYIYVALSSPIVIPLSNALLEILFGPLILALPAPLNYVARSIPLIALLYGFRRLTLSLMRGNIHGALRALGIATGAVTLATAILRPESLVEAATGSPMGSPDILSSLGSTDYSTQLVTGLDRIPEMLSIIARLFWGG